MTIHRPQSFVDVYRLKATAKNLHELAGRPYKPEQTQLVIDHIISKLHPQKDDILVDIGCGDGSLPRRIVEADIGVRRAIGIVPTKEELDRVRQASPQFARSRFRFRRGLSVKTGLPDAFATKIVINGVLLILEDEKTVDATLTEIRRITKPEGTVYIGEVPDRNEFAGRDYGDSISRWLIWTFRHRGFRACWHGLKQTLRGLFTRHPFIIVPKKMFWMERDRFISKLRAHGFEVLDSYPHKEVLGEGSVEASTRWNYIAIPSGDAFVRYRINKSMNPNKISNVDQEAVPGSTPTRVPLDGKSTTAEGESLGI